MNRVSYILATAGVALVVIFDIVTGQGPPQLQSYLGVAPLQYNIPPRVTLLEPNGYQASGQYGYQPAYQGNELKKGGEPKLEAVSAKEYEKSLEDKRGYEIGDYGNKGEKGDKGEYGKETSTAPSGMFGSISNAWKSLTSLGKRTKRGAIDLQGASYSKVNGDPGAEWSQSNNQDVLSGTDEQMIKCYLHAGATPWEHAPGRKHIPETLPPVLDINIDCFDFWDL